MDETKAYQAKRMSAKMTKTTNSNNKININSSINSLIVLDQTRQKPCHQLIHGQTVCHPSLSVQMVLCPIHHPPINNNIYISAKTTQTCTENGVAT